MKGMRSRRPLESVETRGSQIAKAANSSDESFDESFFVKNDRHKFASGLNYQMPPAPCSTSPFVNHHPALQYRPQKRCATRFRHGDLLRRT